MHCVVTEAIRWAQRRNKSLDVLSRYLRLRYGIWLDRSALRKRLESLRSGIQSVNPVYGA